MFKVSLFTTMLFMTAFVTLSYAKEEIDLSIWPNSVGVEKEKSENAKGLRKQEERAIAERVKWILHDNENAASHWEKEPITSPKISPYELK